MRNRAGIQVPRDRPWQEREVPGTKGDGRDARDPATLELLVHLLQPEDVLALDLLPLTRVPEGLHLSSLQRSDTQAGAARRQLNDLPDDLRTRVNIELYKDVVDAVRNGAFFLASLNAKPSTRLFEVRDFTDSIPRCWTKHKRY